MKLLSELKLGNLTLKNRIIMAPLTRMRSAQPGNIPQELNATYYAQRATAGFILSEATKFLNKVKVILQLRVFIARNKLLDGKMLLKQFMIKVEKFSYSFGM